MDELNERVLDELTVLWSDPASTRVEDFAAGQIIFAAGERSDYLAVVLHGEVVIREGERIVERLGRGAIFGEMGVVERQPRCADAVAVSDCRIARIDESRFAQIVERNPRFSLALMRTLTRRLIEVKSRRAAAEPSLDLQGRDELDAALALVGQFRATEQRGCSDYGQYWSRAVGRVNGDFHCAVLHPDRGWYGLLADGVGHGLAPAIFGLHLPVLFRELAQQGLPLETVHVRLNRFLTRLRIADQFVCALLVHLEGRQVRVINAGMPEALLFCADGRVQRSFSSRELPLGIVDLEVGQVEEYRLAHGDTGCLLLYSDGVSEALAPGTEFRDVAERAAQEGVDRLLDSLVSRLEVPGVRPHDDVSLVQLALPCRPCGGAAELGQSAGEGFAARGEPEVATLTQMVDHLDQGLMLTDATMRIQYVNAAFSRVTGYSLAEALDQTPRLLRSHRQPPAFYAQMRHALASSDFWRGEIWNRRKDGSHYLEHLQIRAIRDNEGKVTHYLGTFQPLPSQPTNTPQPNEMAHDWLTGLPNRFLLADRGAQALRRAERSGSHAGVLFIDLDRFKTINDTLGHGVGDKVLQLVCERLATCIRSEDTLARFASDQFVCLLPTVAEREDAAKVVAKFNAALGRPVAVDGHEFKISMSVGVALFPGDARELDDLLVYAERAMREAKAAGGNLVRYFDERLSMAVAKQLEMEAELDAALRLGELELHYQPKVDLDSGAVIGAEALVRWRHPRRGLVPPGQFIPVAERSDLISRIGTWVLDQACAALDRWSDELGGSFQLAVNVSPMQFERTDVCEEVLAAMRRHHIAPSRLQLEITESTFVRDSGAVSEALRRVAEHGVSIALDDFGTGYSNLGSIRELPLDEFKLDQSFVRDIHAAPVSEAIAKALWQLAQGLDKGVVAEGLEQAAEVERVKQIGYRVGQGYWFSKPLPEDQFLASMARRARPSAGPRPAREVVLH